MKTSIYLKDLVLSYDFFSRLITEDIMLSLDQETHSRLEHNHQFLLNHVKDNKKIYGINTGFGKNVSREVKSDFSELQQNLAQYLDCAQGEILPEKVSRLIFLVRIKQASFSGTAMRPEAIEHLINLYNAGVSPIVPTLGSLGASGDLVTMAPMARLLFDQEVSCWYEGKTIPLKEVLQKTKTHLPGVSGRDSLALMNGLAAAATLAMSEILRLNHLLNLSLSSMALCKIAIGANRDSESEILNSNPVRKFKGQKEIADHLRLLYEDSSLRSNSHLQDPYSLRCIPQFMGPVLETTTQSAEWIMNEILSQSDNPYVGESEILNGGNFYGGYLVMASDLMATNLAKVAELLDRQTFHLVGGHYQLPENLITQNSTSSYHGLKGVHQLSNSLLMKIQPQATSYSLAARSSEMHNQDVVSNCMNGWVRVRQLRKDFEILLSSHLTLSIQAVELSQVEAPMLSDLITKVRAKVPFIKKDQGLREFLTQLQESLYDIPSGGPFKL